jgi:hypothetical protein
MKKEARLIFSDWVSRYDFDGLIPYTGTAHSDIMNSKTNELNVMELSDLNCKLDLTEQEKEEMYKLIRNGIVPVFYISIIDVEEETQIKDVETQIKDVEKTYRSAADYMADICDNPENFSKVPTDHDKYYEIAKFAIERDNNNFLKIDVLHKDYNDLVEVILDITDGKFIENVPVNHIFYNMLAKKSVNAWQNNIFRVSKDCSIYYELMLDVFSSDVSYISIVNPGPNPDKYFEVLKELVESDSYYYINEIPDIYERYQELLIIALKIDEGIILEIDRDARKELIRKLISDSEELVQLKEGEKSKE